MICPFVLKINVIPTPTTQKKEKQYKRSVKEKMFHFVVVGKSRKND